MEPVLALTAPPGQRANRHDVPRLAPGSACMPLVLRTDRAPSVWSGWRLEMRCGCGLGAAIPVPWLVREGGGDEPRLMVEAMPWLRCSSCGAMPETVELVDGRGGPKG
jgi:hypothetical protein